MSADLIPWLERQAMGPGHRSELLEQTSWARDFDWKEIQMLAEHTEAYRAPKGMPICHEGEANSFLAIILSGSVAIVKLDSGGGEKVIAELGPDRSFGEMSLIDNEPRSATVITRSNTVFLVMSQAQFQDLCEHNPRTALKLMMRISRGLSQRLRRVSGKLTDYLE